MAWSLSQALAVLTLAAFAAVVGMAALGVWERVRTTQPVSGPVTGWLAARAAARDSALGVAWLVALVATLGSLYLSEIVHYPPCTLCWLQRIAMYPLVVVLGIGALRDDAGVRWYALPLAASGAGLALYHAVLQRVPGLQGATSCSASAPCDVMWLREFGFVSIPVMALGAFLLIAGLLLVVWSPPAAKPAAATRRRRRR